ncbi:hypothetical protein CHS0354_015944 [Potamilus streckersoni]|uniref:Cap-specific mRNA (nucleoside-2'-O-)-methyltransferase 2 n=1 Tax=Potamilus streckersoni TaxID=2493646 RepID=A0AAE0SYR0_9BIVA|nr:hypothetical protein CHS0354_015944 [Potamilus streckersoni]
MENGNSKRRRHDSQVDSHELSADEKLKVEKLFQKKFSYQNPGSWKLSREENHGDYSSDREVCVKDTSCDAVETLSFFSANATINKQEIENKTLVLNSCKVLERDIHFSGDDSLKFSVKPELIKMKDELNEVKNKLNDKDILTWHRHTSDVNIAGNIVNSIAQRFKPELCTQAWCKFYEIASSYKILDLSKPALLTIHLCEAPGAFVTSLNHYLHCQGYNGEWEWRASTLNPHYEGNHRGQMIDDDRFIKSTVDNWYFGKDNTGNLMTLQNLEGLIEIVQEIGFADLVTADGSIDCQDNPAEQENIVSQLHYCEVLTALHILSPGGTLVIKLFTMYEYQAISLMYILNCMFTKVEVFKPCTSKGGNSEVYVICLQLHGDHKSYLISQLTQLYFCGGSRPEIPVCPLPLEDLPDSFLEQHCECCQFFNTLQCQAINRNLELYQLGDDLKGEADKVEGDHKAQEEEEVTLNASKHYCLELFLEKYNLDTIADEDKIVQKSHNSVRRHWNQSTPSVSQSKGCHKESKGTFQMRVERSSLSWKQKVFLFTTYTDDILDKIRPYKSRKPPHRQDDVCCWTCATGFPVQEIHSSRFGDSQLITATQELFHNAQCLKQMTRKQEIRESEVQVLYQILSIMSENHPSASFNMKDNERELPIYLVYENTVPEVIQKVREVMEKKIYLLSVDDNCGSDVLPRPDLTVYFEDATNQSRQGLQTELQIQKNVLSILIHSLKNLQRKNSLIIKMSTCLTRISAGLIFLFSRCFAEIGFHPLIAIDHLEQYLVCWQYSRCPDHIIDHLVHVMQRLEDSDDSGMTILEVVPVVTILQDFHFTQFLTKVNNDFMKRYITEVVEKEKIFYQDNSDIQTADEYFE